MTDLSLSDISDELLLGRVRAKQVHVLPHRSLHIHVPVKPAQVVEWVVEETPSFVSTRDLIDLRLEVLGIFDRRMSALLP